MHTLKQKTLRTTALKNLLARSAYRQETGMNPKPHNLRSTSLVYILKLPSNKNTMELENYQYFSDV